MNFRKEVGGNRPGYGPPGTVAYVTAHFLMIVISAENKRSDATTWTN